MKLKISIILIALFTSQLYAQVVSGIVQDEAGKALPGCNIFVANTYFGASSNADGSFRFSVSGVDSITLKAVFLGFEAFEKRMLLKGDVQLSITLKEAFNRLNVVTVTAGMYGSGEAEEAVVLSSLDIVTTAGALGDVIGAMQTLPGTATNGESGKLFVHGGSASETGTYIDGILVHEPYSSSAPNMAVRGRFNPFMFSGTAFSTGGYSAEYGQALSSVLVLNTNELPEQESLNLSLMSIGGDVAGTKMWKNGAITASANYMNLKPYMQLIPQNYVWNKEPEAFGGAINFRQKTAGKGLLKVYATIDQSNLSQQQNLVGESNLVQNVNLTNNNRFVNANWKGMISPKWILKAGSSFTYNVNAFDLDHVALTEALRGSHIKALAINEVNERIHIRLGAEYFYKNFSESYLVKATQKDSSLNFSDNKTAAFVEAQIYTSRRFVVNTGLRAEYSSYIGLANLAPRISAAYELGKGNQFSLAYGIFYQDPINSQMLGHKGLGYEKATHYIFSFNKEIGKRTLRAELYYKQYDNLVKYASSVSKSYTNDGTGYAGGLDLYYHDKKTIKNGDFWVSYSYLLAERNYLNYPTTATPSFANAHSVSVVYKHWFENLHSLLGATLSYSSPRPFNNPNSPEFMGDKLKAYRSLDMNWSYLYSDNIIIHAAISNVLGFNNVFGYNFSPVADASGVFQSTQVLPAAKRFFFIGCFITLSKNGKENQLNKIQ